MEKESESESERSLFTSFYAYIYISIHTFHMSIAYMKHSRTLFSPKQSHFKYASMPALTCARIQPPNFQLNRNAPIENFKRFIYIRIIRIFSCMCPVCVCACGNDMVHELLCVQASMYICVIIIIIGFWHELEIIIGFHSTCSLFLVIHSASNRKCTTT